ncbi:MAG: hypothetical protein AAGF11_25380, partial [Myxococcota bacterium]
PQLQIEIRPVQLRVHDLAVGTASKGHPWTYYAFMSGLRSVGLTADTGAHDLQRLARRLAELRLDASMARGFRDWAWEEDGEGITLVVTRTFCEVFEGVSESFDARATVLAAVRSEQALPVGVGVLLDSREIDRAALRPEYEVSLVGYRGRVDRREHEVTGSVLCSLSRGVSATFTWATAELETILCAPALRRTLPAGRVGRRLMEVLGGPQPERALELLARMGEDDRSYTQRVRAQLSVSEVASVLLDNEHAPPYRRWAMLRRWLADDEPFAREIIRTIVVRLSRADTGGNEPLITSLLQGPEAQLVLDLLADEQLRPPLAAWLGVRVDAAQLRLLLARVTPAARVAVLCARPIADLRAHRQVVVELIEHDEHRERFVKHLLQAGEGEACALLLDVLIATQAKPWNARLAALACHRVREAPGGSDQLVKLVGSYRSHPVLRVAALAGLRADPARLRRACRWRLRELFSPVGVQAALREARRAIAS